MSTLYAISTTITSARIARSGRNTSFRFPNEQLIQPVPYSHGLVRNQLAHLMSVDDAWFSGLRSVEPDEAYEPPDFDDRAQIRAR
jgi:hypothetical protein